MMDRGESTVRQSRVDSALGIGLVVLSLLVGCDSKPKPGGQVAAQVNGREITIHEVNRQLLRTEVSDPESVSGLKREVLEELIDQELLVQRAVADKLDRDPEVMREIDRARDAILAESVVKRQLAGRPDPSDDEIQTFLTTHPELFAKRRIYTLEQFTVAGDAVDGTLTSRLDAARSAHDIERVLKESQVPYTSEALTRGAEQLPMALAAQLLALKRGDIVSYRDGDEVRVVFVQDFEEAAVGEQLARINTLQYLQSAAREAVLSRTLEQLRKAAEIRYVGEFAGQTADGNAEAKGGGVAPGQQQTLPEHMERGVSGLVK